MVLNPELYNLGHFIKILILGLHSGPHAIVYYRTNLRDSKSLFFHFSFVCMLSDCTWKADSTVLHIALNSLHWIPFQSQFSMSVPAFPSLESLWGSAERIASTGILIAWLILEMQLPPLWCDLHHFLSCRNYPIILSYIILHLLFFLELLCIYSHLSILIVVQWNVGGKKGSIFTKFAILSWNAIRAILDTFSMAIL